MDQLRGSLVFLLLLLFFIKKNFYTKKTLLSVSIFLLNNLKKKHF